MRLKPRIWFLVSLALFAAAFYFWRLGDERSATQTNKANKPGSQSATVPPTSSTSASPFQQSNTPSIHSSSTNRFPYRLSNTTQTIGDLARNDRAILLRNALIDTSKPLTFDIPDHLKSKSDPGSYII